MEKSSSMTPKLTGESFIIFGEDFGRHPHALEHIMRPHFGNNKFIWVETIGLRSPRLSLYDFKRIFGKLARWMLEKKNIEKRTAIPLNVTVISPIMLPYNQFKFVRLFNKWSVGQAVKKILRTQKINAPITIASVPNACDYVGCFDEKLKIYFCVDEFSLWPGLDKLLVSAMEEKLIERSDIIVATSDLLAKTKTKKNKTTRVITHGVDFEHFNIAAKEGNISTLKICYFGLFDERSDQDIILEISKLIDVEITIIGNCVCNIEKLKSRPNIHFRGPIPYQDLPKALHDVDAFILPYPHTELAQYINPLKLKEYLCTKRPVIATGLPEVLKLKDYVFIAENSSDFVNLITKIKDGSLNYDYQKTISYIKQNETWQAKAEKLAKIIKEVTTSTKQV